jgi:diguanylate cyclase (GGDEF)-like protein
MEQATMNHIDRELLDDLPIGLLLLDRDDRVGWANRRLAELLGMPDTNLTGQQLGQLSQEAQRLLATEPQLYRDEVGQRWIRRMVQRGAAGERLVMLTDETEQERLAEENARLRQQVEDLKLTDELTGLPNRRAITQSLELHVSRSRRYQNPLSTVLVHIDMHRFTGVQPMSTDPVILGVSRFLRDRLRWVDQIARWEDTVFLLVLPETTEEDARGLLDKIAAEAHNMPLPEAFGDLLPGLSFGLACWQKGDDVRTLLRRAVQDLRDHSGA